MSGRKKEKTSLSFLPVKLKRCLMKFQKDGIRYGIRKNGRCMIGDEMGLGKTLQAISIAYYYKSKWPLLIVAPSSMRFSWVNELEAWIPDIQPGDINLVNSSACIGSMMNYRINIIGYGLMSQQRSRVKSIGEVIMETKFGVAIIDESHYIKNMKSIRTKQILKTFGKIPHVILLSGTPSLSRPEELFPQITLVHPRLFGSFKSFSEQYCNGHYVTERGRGGKIYQKYDTSGASNLEELHCELVENVMIRRLKKDVLTQLPAKRRQKIMFEIGENSCYKKELAASYDGLKGMLKSLTNEQYDEDNIVTSNQYGVSFMQLFTATAKAKAAAVQQYICDMLDGMDNKFLVFCYHLTMVQAVRQTLLQRKVKHICITGEVKSLQRGIDVQTFQTDPNCRVAVLSIQAASTGLTLTAADHVIFAELHYTPGILVQAEDRCHRIGQKNAVQVHYLIAMETIDEFLWSCLQRKVAVTSATLNGKVSDLPVDGEDFSKNALLSAVEAWQPVSISVTEDLAKNLFVKKPDHKDIRLLLSQPTKKKKKKKKRKANHVESIDLLSDDDDDDFKPSKKKQKKSQKSSDLALLVEDDLSSESETNFLGNIHNNMNTLEDDGSSKLNDQQETTAGHMEDITARTGIVTCLKINEDMKTTAARTDSNDNNDDILTCSKSINEDIEKTTFLQDEHTNETSIKHPGVTLKIPKRSSSSSLSKSELTTTVSTEISAIPLQNNTTKENQFSLDNIISQYRKEESTLSSREKHYDSVPHPVDADVVSLISVDESSSDGNDHKSDLDDSKNSSLIIFQNCKLKGKNENRNAFQTVETKLIVVEDKCFPKKDIEKGPDSLLLCNNDSNDSKDDSTKWNCSACTFLNHRLVNSCEICGTVKIENSLSSNTVVDNSRSCSSICNENFPSETSPNNSYFSEIELFSSDSDGEPDYSGASKKNKVTTADLDTSITSCNSSRIDKVTTVGDDLDTSITSCNSSNMDFTYDYNDDFEDALSQLTENKLNTSGELFDVFDNESSKQQTISPDKLVTTTLSSEVNYFENDSLDGDMIELTNEDIDNSGKNGDGSSDDTDDEEEVQEELKKISFKYRISFYTQRVYLYDEFGVYLKMHFNVQDINMRVYDDLSPLLLHDENLKQLRIFGNQWKQLGPLQQSLVRKGDRTYQNPGQFYKEIYEERHGMKAKNLKRYVSKDDEHANIKKVADDVGGKVIKLKPVDDRKTKNGKRNTATSNSPGKSLNKIDKSACSIDVLNESAGILQAVDADGYPLCLYCSNRVQGLKAGTFEARYCSQKCLEDHKVRRNGQHFGARDLLFEVEHGICQLCGIDANSIYQQVLTSQHDKRKDILEGTPYLKLPMTVLNRMITNPKAGLFWEADHIQAVVEGGGQCGIENYRTLCTPCHRNVTKQLRKKLAKTNTGKAYKSLKDFFGKNTVGNT